jgi:molybdopterin synthase catalytic subunit
MKRVFVQQEDFDPGAVQAELESLAPGAIAAFTGLVRNDGGMTGLTLEHYPGMTEAMLHALADQAIERWSLQGICIVHRIGSLKIGDRIVLVVCASAHRAAFFCHGSTQDQSPLLEAGRAGQRIRKLGVRQSGR